MLTRRLETTSNMEASKTKKPIMLKVGNSMVQTSSGSSKLWRAVAREHTPQDAPRVLQHKILHNVFVVTLLLMLGLGVYNMVSHTVLMLCPKRAFKGGWHITCSLYNCTWWARGERGATGGPAHEVLLQTQSTADALPHCLLREVAGFLSVPDLGRFAAAGAVCSKLQEDVWSYELLLDEVRRLDLENEWNSEVQYRQAIKDSKDTEALAALRFFLQIRSRGLLQDRGMQTSMRRREMAVDMFRFVLLLVCWFSLVCHVVQMARIKAIHMATVGKACISPFLFLYVLESDSQQLRRLLIVGAVALYMLIGCSGHLKELF